MYLPSNVPGHVAPPPAGGNHVGAIMTAMDTTRSNCNSVRCCAESWLHFLH